MNISLVHIQPAFYPLAVNIDTAIKLVCAIVLLAGHILEEHEAITVLDNSPNTCYRLPINGQIPGRQPALKQRAVNSTGQLAAELSPALQRHRQILVVAAQVNLMHAGIQIDVRLRVNGAVKVHIQPWRKHMKILQGNSAILDKVVTVHAVDENAIIAALIKMHIAGNIRIFQGAGNRNDIVHIAGQLLTWIYGLHDVLHAGTDSINTHVDFLVTQEAHDALGVPLGLLPLLHDKILDLHAPEAAPRRTMQPVKRLMINAAVPGSILGTHNRIINITCHGAFDIQKARYRRLRHKISKQGQINI